MLYILVTFWFLVGWVGGWVLGVLGWVNWLQRGTTALAGVTERCVRTCALCDATYAMHPFDAGDRHLDGRPRACPTSQCGLVDGHCRLDVKARTA